MIKTSYISLLLVLVSTNVHSAVIIDQNIKRIQENECITIDFLEKYEPTFFPRWELRVSTVNAHTAEEVADILMVLYGCDLLAEESKLNADNEYQDGIVYMIWGFMGMKADGSRKTIFDMLKSKFLVTLKMSFDERIYSTLDEALNSPEVKRSVKQYGAEKINIQGFTLKGEDRGLFNLDRTLANEVVK